MAELINLVTWTGVNVTPLDDALVYEAAVGESGLFYGVGITKKDANTLHVAAGHGIICGRKFTVVEGDIPVELSPSGTLHGRVYLHLDLSNVSDPIQILVERGSSLTPPIQDDDVNVTNGTYEIDLCTFTISSTEISNLQNVAPIIQPESADEIRREIELAHTQYMHTFSSDSWILQSGGVWDGYYYSRKTGRTIHNPSGSVRASGTTLSSPPTDEVKKAVSSMYFEIDDTANTLTAYTKTAPTETVYVAVEGVQ